MKAITKNINLIKKLNEANDKFSIAESKVLALEEQPSSFDPQKSLKNTSKEPKKSEKTQKIKKNACPRLILRPGRQPDQLRD